MDFETKFPQRPEGHEYYAELCSLAGSGALTGWEQAEFNAHLAQCNECQTVLREYRVLAKSGMALLASDHAIETNPAPPDFSLENARKRTLNRIERQKAMRHRSPIAVQPQPLLARVFPRFQVPLRMAADVVLAAVIFVSAYHLGEVRVRRTVQDLPQPSVSVQVQRGDGSAGSADQPALLETQLAAQKNEVRRLEEELKRQLALVQQSKASQEKLQHEAQEQSSTVAALSSDKSVLASERDALTRKLEETQSALTVAQQHLESLEQEHDRQLLRNASLQARVSELSIALDEGHQKLQNQESFLASDRDIRELMGARDLYIADVFDIDSDGKTQKTFGRVFYTGGKSLIFYAFDLDKQPGVRAASTFQAWGRHGLGDKRPQNMGIFYLDNAANRRWVLRFDDPKTLAEIDAVFVTLEPKGGRQKPTGKQLMFASLRTPPNHP